MNIFTNLIKLLSSGGLRVALGKYFAVLKVVIVIGIICAISYVVYYVHSYIEQSSLNEVKITQLEKTIQEKKDQLLDKEKSILDLLASIRLMSDTLEELRERNSELQNKIISVKKQEYEVIANVKKETLAELKEKQPGSITAEKPYADKAATVAKMDQQISVIRAETMEKLFCSLEVQTTQNIKCDMYK